MQAEFELWQSAISSTLGFISRYLAPKAYDMHKFHLSGRSLNIEDNFLHHIKSRIELSRAAILVDVLNDIRNSEIMAFRHEVAHSKGRVEGTILIPRLVRERASGRSDIIPVLRAKKNADTPEGLFISEIISSSVLVCRRWSRLGGSEGRLAKKLLNFYLSLENEAPWGYLRNKPRPSLEQLQGIVSARLSSGWSPRGGIVDRLLHVLKNEADAVTSSVGDIAFFISNDPRYQDRMFELICLGWLVNAAQKEAPSFVLHENNFLDLSGPIASSRDPVNWKIFYQKQICGNVPSYEWRRTKKKLRAIPDYVLETQSNTVRHIILDAKNRPRSSPSEIIYKMLGYKENLRLEPFRAIAIAPSYSGTRFHHVQDGHGNVVSLLYLELHNGGETIRRILHSSLLRQGRVSSLSAT